MADQVPKTIGTQSISGASQPSKLAPSVEYSSNKLGKTKSVSDGTTDVAVSVLNKKDSDIGSLPLREKQHYAPCINPSCKSFGKSHPNCLCYAGPGGTSLEQGYFAHGGCVGPHKESCEHYADGGQIEQNNLIANDPRAILDHSAISHGLLGLLTKLGRSKTEDKNKHIDEYLSHYKRGNKALHSHIENIFNGHHSEIKPNKDSREALKSHLQHLREHPEDLLNVGGDIGDNLPDHAAQLGVLTGNATNHLNSLRPENNNLPSKPLDSPIPKNKEAEAHYDRHLDIANHPLIVLQHLKDGTLRPGDVSTLQTLYPKLYQNMISKTGEALITAKAQNTEIPFREKQSLSTLLNQPMDSTQTPQAMQAIMMANAGPQQPQPQQSKNKSPKKASGVELKQIDKTNDMYLTDLQQREADKKD